MLLTGSDADILAKVRAQFHGTPPSRIGVAVSGGGDSLALLHILRRCFEPGEVEIHAATVDHGLRPEAAEEAAMVAGIALGLGVPHHTLHWGGWDGTGNMQDRARTARYELLAEWARAREITVLALGHTADDQAETLLMRLARGSGVDGLAGMAAQRTAHGVTLKRPLLGIGRAELREYLMHNRIEWVDDPSNDDQSFDRIKARNAMEVLAPLGLTASALSQVAENMSQARAALNWYTFLAAREVAVLEQGDVLLDLRQFRTLPAEIGRRLLTRAINWVGSTIYPPRRAAVLDALDAIRQGRTVTLAGCQIEQQGQSVRIFREYNAVRDVTCQPDAPWDNRWRVSGGFGIDCELRALGVEGLEQIDNWREAGIPRASLLASPSVWRGDMLISAPLAGMTEGWHAELVDGGEGFFASLLSH